MSLQKIKNIIFDCERMKYMHTGLYHFCLQLGNALIKNSNPISEKISFYLPGSAIKIFNSTTDYIIQKSMHKFIFPINGKYDIWHSTYQGSNYMPSSNRIKKVLTIHDLNFIYEHEKRTEKIKRSLKKIQKQIDNADRICTISAYTKKDVLENLEIKNKQIEVIYNGCNISHLDNLQSPFLLPTRQFIFTIGTISHKKNFHVLPALLRNNDLLLIIAGITQQQDYQTKIKTQAEKYGVADRVFFTGSISENDKQWYLQKCEAFAFTSIAEGFGLPVIEAMAFGKPVFLSKSTSLPEIGGEMAYYFQNFDPDDMQAVFQKGMEHYKLFNPSKAIIEKALGFSWDKAALQYLKIYKELF